MTPYYQDDSCTIYHGDCRAGAVSDEPIAEYDDGVPIFWCREPGCQLPGEHMGGHSSTVPKVFMQEPREMPVSWGYRYEAGMMDDGDWRVGGIA